MGVIWNDEADARLLVGVLITSTPKIDYKALAKFMGPDCTVSAVQHRIQRLKEKVKMPASDQGTASASAPATPEASPAKRGRGRPPKKKVTEEPQAKKVKAEHGGVKGVKEEDVEDVMDVKEEV